MTRRSQLAGLGLVVLLVIASGCDRGDVSTEDVTLTVGRQFENIFVVDATLTIRVTDSSGNDIHTVSFLLDSTDPAIDPRAALFSLAVEPGEYRVSGTVNEASCSTPVDVAEGVPMTVITHVGHECVIERRPRVRPWLYCI